MLDFTFIWLSANYFVKPCQKQDVLLRGQNKEKGTLSQFYERYYKIIFSSAHFI